MYDILIENCSIISMNKRNDIFDRCSIGITGGKIESIGPDLKGGASKVIKGKGTYVMPGLINCHTHVYQSLIEGVGYDMHFNPWNIRYLIPIVSKMKPHHARISGELAAIEMIKSGTTTFSDHWYLHTDFNNIEEEAEAFNRSGLRSHLVFGFLNESFAGRKNANGSGAEVLKEESELLERAEDFVSRRHGQNLITAGLGPGSTEDVGTELFRKIISLARKLDVSLVTHIAGWVEIVSRSIEKYGMRDLEYAHSLGFTGDKSIAIHGVWLSEDEIEIAAVTGTGIAHNPVANMNLGYGIAPICRMRKAGIKVGLGTDGAASYTYDMFEIGKAAAMLQKVHKLDAEALTAEDVLSMLTREGASLLGIDEITGSIEVGKQADLIMINADSPNILGGGRPAPLIAYGARSSDVINSIIGGRLVMEDRKVLTLDEKSVLSDANDARTELLELGGSAVKELLDAPWPGRGASWRRLDGQIS
ncbi:MAG: amidohydrolase [Spirochaetales bacterium]|nr:amidohydrolase [Spirochaetales bacterium]